MKDDQILLRATRFISRRKFGDAIRLLEPEVVRYHDSFRYYYLLAISCLRSGDFGGALTYFRRAREIKMRDPSVLLGLAVLHLRRGETDRAVELYLEILEKEPKNRQALRALNIIRKRGDPEALSAYIESGRVEKLYPASPKAPPSPLGIAAAAAISTLAVAGVFFIAAGSGIVKSPIRKPAAREGIDSIKLETADKKAAVEAGGSYRYILTKSAIVDEFEEARRLFLDYRDEAARIRINRLLESNAAVSVKQKARLLSEYAAVPGFDTLKDRYGYSTVIAEPLLYRDVHVLWRGMATNLKEADRSTDFDLLVGYDTRSSLEGIVPVRFEFAVPVDVERPLEVLGRIALSGDKIRLVGLAIHQAAAAAAK
jgi:hypothetical protein